MQDCPRVSLLALISQMQQTKLIDIFSSFRTHATLSVFFFSFQIADIAGFAPYPRQTPTASSVPKGEC